MKLTCLFLVLFSLIFNTECYCQFVKSFRTDSSNFFTIADISVLANNEFLICGDIFTPTVSGNVSRTYYAKLDSTGSPLWCKTLDRPNTHLYYITPVFTGGFMLTGRAYFPASTPYGAIVVSIDSIGDTLFTRSFSQDIFYQALQCPDSSILISGYGNDQFGYSGLLIKMDTSGNIIWKNLYGNESVYASLDADGGYSSICHEAASLSTIMKTDSAGNPIWNYKLGNNDFLGSRCLSTKDNGHIITGTAIPDDCIILKMDSSANILWSNRYSAPDFLGAVSIAETEDSCFIVLAYLYHYPGTSPDDMVIFKLDAFGNVMWSRKYLYGAGNLPRKISILSNNSILASCYMNSHISIMDSLGNTTCISTPFTITQTVFPISKNSYPFSTVPDSSIESFSTTMGSDIIMDSLWCNVVNVNEPEQKGLTNIYPNPASDQIKVSCALHCMMTISIYNAIGSKLIFQTNIDEVIIPLNNLPNGIYFLNVEINNKVERKIMIKAK